MKKMLFILICLSLLTVLPVQAQESAVPKLINYQGRLTDENGKELTGNRKVEFNLYDAAIGGNKLWGPQVFENVSLENGHFNVILGPTDTQNRTITDAFSSANCFIGIKVGNVGDDLTDVEEISPRQQILSSPYAIKAEQATKADYAIKSGTALEGIPSGGIIMWSGSHIPEGWALCDGNNGTPDLRDRFIVSAGVTYKIGSPPGGTVRHSHICSGTTSLEGRTENVQKGSGNEMADDKHTHNFSCTTTENEHIPPYYVLAFIMKI